jgi:UDP-N-acetylmuramate--alanine ligase
MKSKNYDVSGSDLKPSELTKALEKEGIKVFYSQISNNITSNIELIVKTSAVKENEETIKAKEFNIPILIRGEFLSLISNEYNLIAVAGSHGKTTTTALVTYALKKIRDDISFNVGGILSNFNTNSQIKESGIFVTEADESDGSFLNLLPKIAILNNLDPEHLDHYGNFDNLKKAFQNFANQSNIFVWNIDDKNLSSVLSQSPKGRVVVKNTFGLSKDAFYTAKNIVEENFTTYFDFYKGNEKIKRFEIPLTGKYNVLNTVGAISAIDKLDIINILDLDFSDFKGVKRRSELIYKNKEKKISLYDDYAHHPIEIEQLFHNILREKNIVILYQPHRYTRTRDSFGEIVRVLKMPKNLVVLKEYSASEEFIEGATAQDIFSKLDKESYDFLRFANNKKEAEELVTSVFNENYTIFSVGAGNLNEVLYSLKDKI